MNRVGTMKVRKKKIDSAITNIPGLGVLENSDYEVNNGNFGAKEMYSAFHVYLNSSSDVF